MKKKNYSKLCGVCDKKVSHYRRHMMREHIPWYMSPAYACVDCNLAEDSGDLERYHGNHLRLRGDLLGAWFLLVNGFFLLIGRSLGLSNLSDVLGYVVAENLFTPDSRFSEEELFFVREYDRLAGLECNERPSACPPNRVSGLLHYHVVTRLLCLVSPETRSLVLNNLQYSNPDGTSPPAGHPVLKLGYMDGHFHLDELVVRSQKSFRELEIFASPTFRLIHAVANFVYPSKWGLIPELMGVDSRIKFSLGVHPHLLLSHNVESMYRRLCDMFTRYPSAVAVGEVGLDFTTSCRCKPCHHDRSACKRSKIEAQHIFLEKVLRLAHELGKPVIIHCRDSGDGSAAKGVFKALTSLNLTNHPIQRHCFVGSIQEFDEWSTLPNCYFSLSRESVMNEDTREALFMCGHRRVLLETDSPYLPFPGDDVHGPWRVEEVANYAACMLGLRLPELIRLSNRNIASLFGLPW